jgi:hypothetical protein
MKPRIELKTAVPENTANAADTQSPAQFFRFAGAPRSEQPILHGPDSDCSKDRLINPGPVVEMAAPLFPCA